MNSTEREALIRKAITDPGVPLWERVRRISVAWQEEMAEERHESYLEGCANALRYHECFSADE